MLPAVPRSAPQWQPIAMFVTPGNPRLALPVCLQVMSRSRSVTPASRRDFLARAAGAAGIAALAVLPYSAAAATPADHPLAAAPGTGAAPGRDPAFDRLWPLVQRELDRLGPAIPLHDRVGVADYSLPSDQPRFYLLDVAAATASSYLVAHGRGSDPDHSGRVQRFSNDFGSYASSEGAYRTGDLYVGKHGRSMRLAGLDETNDNAEPRAIVIHKAWYVSHGILGRLGKLGRSEGCFVFAEDEADLVMEALGPDRLLLAGRFGA